MGLNKHIAIPISEQDAFHSSGFAKVASGDRVGTVSRDMFTRRSQLDARLRIVNSFCQHNVGQSHTVPANNSTEPDLLKSSGPGIDSQTKV